MQTFWTGDKNQGLTHYFQNITHLFSLIVEKKHTFTHKAGILYLLMYSKVIGNQDFDLKNTMHIFRVLKLSQTEIKENPRKSPRVPPNSATKVDIG